jgi:hypothetical protein
MKKQDVRVTPDETARLHAKALLQKAKLGLSACVVGLRPLKKNLSSAKYFASEFARMNEVHDELHCTLLQFNSPYYTGKNLKHFVDKTRCSCWSRTKY